MSEDVIDGGGGDYYSGASEYLSGAGGKPDESLQPKGLRRSLSSAEAKICRGLDIPYCGFLLYHSGHTRLRYFLERHLGFLDRVSGPRFRIFVLTDQHDQSLRIDERLQSGLLKEELIQVIEKWRRHAVPFSADRSFAVAEALGIPRSELPSLLIYRLADGYEPCARLRMKDAWFPKDDAEVTQCKETKEWMSALFDALERSMANGEANVVARFQHEMDRLARSQLIWKPIAGAMRQAIVPLVKLPFDVVSSLSAIVQNVGTSALKKKLQGLMASDD
jgi:hypothetical protein